MCWAEKCCYFVPLHLACFILGVANFVISTGSAVASLVCYFSEEKIGDLKDQPHFVAEFLGLDLKMSTVNIILTVITIISVLWMMFSVLLIFGITKSRPNMLLSYFSFGIMLTILGQLAALLLLLSKCWGLAFTIFFASLINIHYLVVVHTAYELMLKGNDFRFRRQVDDDDDTLADCFDESTSAEALHPVCIQGPRRSEMPGTQQHRVRALPLGGPPTAYGRAEVAERHELRPRTGPQPYNIY